MNRLKPSSHSGMQPWLDKRRNDRPKGPLQPRWHPNADFQGIPVGFPRQGNQFIDYRDWNYGNDFSHHPHYGLHPDHRKGLQHILPIWKHRG